MKIQKVKFDYVRLFNRIINVLLILSAAACVIVAILAILAIRGF